MFKVNDSIKRKGNHSPGAGSSLSIAAVTTTGYKVKCSALGKEPTYGNLSFDTAHERYEVCHG